MTKYRVAQQEDFPVLTELAKKHGLHAPEYGGCFVVEVDNEIVGFINGGVVGMVETIVADSGIVAGRLFSMMEGSLLTAVPNTNMYAVVVNPFAGDLLKSQGWEKVDAEFYIKRR